MLTTRQVSWFFGLLLLAAAPLHRAAAQEAPLGRMLFTAGVTTTNSEGRTWAYVFWQGTDRTLLEDESFAVSMKEGDASSAQPFRVAGVVRQASDPAVVSLLIGRAVHLGEDTYALEGAIDEMFSGMNTYGLPIEEKILAVILGSYADPDAYEKLRFLARRHPVLAMAMGSAIAVPLTNSVTHTFELRTYADGAAGDVLGRVTLDPANPVMLPAPDRLAEVPDTTPMGHLNIRLRWEEPDDLLRLSLLQFGYHVYRLDYDTAVARGWDTGVPPRADFLDQVSGGTDAAKQVNRLPAMYDDEGGTNAFFFADDNDRFNYGAPFVDGSRYMYYVAAADVLGQPGLISTGLLVTVCDRTPPLLPRNLDTSVVRDYDAVSGEATNHIRITWRQVPETDSSATVEYYVFRWSSMSQMQAAATGSLTGAIAGPIAHDPGQVFNAYTDTSAPADQATAWYTVQAAEIVACGTNFSGHSAPSSGFIPDLSGPENPLTNGTIRIFRCDPFTVVAGNPVTDQFSDLNRRPILTCDRLETNESILWAEFFYAERGNDAPDFDDAIPLGRVYFKQGQPRVELSFNPLDLPKASAFVFFCRIGTSDGQISEPAFKIYDGSLQNLISQGFLGFIYCREGTAGPGDDDVHRPTGGIDFGPGPFIKPEVEFGPMTVDTLDHRFLLHQQIDGGPLTLIGQFLVESNLLGTVVTLTNEMAGTMGCSEICLYQEEVDENGISLGQVFIDCYRSTVTPPPPPDLLPLDPAGTETNPAVAISWFCAPQGVERFEVWVGLEDETVPVTFSSSLTTNLAPSSNPVPFEDTIINFGVYQTGRVGQNFGAPDSPDFNVEIPISLGKEYYVRIHALDACGNRTASQTLTFGWYPPPVGPDVPWPARPLPPVSGNFHPLLEAVVLDPSEYAFNPKLIETIPAVRIGVITQVFVQTSTCHPANSNDPVEDFVFRSSSSGELLLPIMLYRYQVTNATMPRVSGDIVQVSPLIDEIAYEVNSPAASSIYICDPFIRILLDNLQANDPSDIKTYEMFLIDTQPVISGATYVYLVVQFDETTGEPVRVIPLNEVTMP